MSLLLLLKRRAPAASAPVAATGAIEITSDPVDGDTVTIGGIVVTFRDEATLPFEIGISPGEPSGTAGDLAALISANTGSALCDASEREGPLIHLVANTAGAAGNSITLSTTSAAVALTPFSGGAG
jgi:hypothetical protein